MVRTVKFKDGRRKRYVGIVYDAICPADCYGEACLYLQQRRKRYKNTKEKVNEITIPLSEIQSMF